ncbi:PhzF family phenazine biosynthesis protein [Gayadomonas joobiniege]|uniref:PhzF family phenazine biosynthesis protein n=1 Tax=Gayadomonas joobiniege TaxID=1234606 RepID=UPI000361F8BB|nr:PhzF family phenazine biosynthesis protein [Gayadomonas joobiniege]
MTIQYFTVDVFTNERFQGAQIAVIPDANTLTESQMLKIAEEFRVWRTVFIFPSTHADYKIRIFNGKREFKFGGHPTIAAIFVLSHIGALALKEGENPFKLEESHGIVKCSVQVKDGKPIFNQYSATSHAEVDVFTPSTEELSAILSLESYHFNVNGFKPLLVSTHTPYIIVPVDSFESLQAARFNYDAWARSAAPATCANSILLFCGKGAFSSSDFHCRLVGPVFGIHEDPPIGASVPAFAAYLNEFKAYKTLPYHFVAERGAYTGRSSLLHVDVLSRNDQDIGIKIGGNATLFSEGKLYI